MKENAILLLNKPANVSSNKAVNTVKHILGASKAGHLGTLDVLGEGLLPITLNKATKLFDFFLDKDKEYITTFKFGQTSPTLDLEGPLTDEDINLDITEAQILSILPKFIGKQNQIPPQYSAKKVNGQKAYDLARKGKEAKLKPKQIEIYDIKLLQKCGKNTFKFKIHCSSGTFIRSICRDLAEQLSTCGIMLNIIRTRCGIFKIEDSYTISDIEKDKYSLINPEILFDLPILQINDQQFSLLQNGVQIVIPNGKYKLFYEKEFLGIGESNQENKLKMIIKLF